MNQPKNKNKTALDRKLRNVRMLIVDVDGVLTDGGIILGNSGQEFKIFNVQDGMGVTLARAAGLKVGIITGRSSEAVAIRAQEIHADVLYQGAFNKLEPYLEILEGFCIGDEVVCYIGDDLLDIPVMERVGVAVAVANARDEVKKIADYVTYCGGGRGAVREVVDLILKSQKKWSSVLNKINSGSI